MTLNGLQHRNHIYITTVTDDYSSFVNINTEK